MYSYDDINDYLHKYMDSRNHKNADDSYNINVLFVLSSYKVVIEISSGYQLDLRNTIFKQLIGFDEKIVNTTEYGVRLPNITNSIDIINISTDAITDSLVDGENTNTIIQIPTDNLTRSYPFTYEPRRIHFSPLASTSISQMRFYVTDSLNRPINLNNIDWFMTLVLKTE